jgi:hypothetical protein
MLHPLLKQIISMEEIDLLKEDSHFPGTKIFSMDIRHEQSCKLCFKT